MNTAQMSKRLEKLEPHGGEYDHLSDEDLQQSIEWLTKSILTNIGGGDPQVGYEMFKSRCREDLPETFEAFAAEKSSHSNGELSAYFDELREREDG